MSDLKLPNQASLKHSPIILCTSKIVWSTRMKHGKQIQLRYIAESFHLILKTQELIMIEEVIIKIKDESIEKNFYHSSTIH
jgi:hypothetical protein